MSTHDNTGEERYQAMNRLIAEHLASPELGTDWLAEQLGVSARQLQRISRNAGQTTVTHLIAEARLQRAWELIVERDMPTRAVAPLVGYRGGAYLAKRFRQRFGLAPHEAREAGPRGE